MEIEITERGICITSEKSLISKEALYKCFYWYGNRYEVVISDHSATEYQVILTPFQGINTADEVTKRIKRDLLDFALRDIVTKETQSIRELLVAKAFAYYDTDHYPSASVSDPVGFDPLMIKED